MEPSSFGSSFEKASALVSGTSYEWLTSLKAGVEGTSSSVANQIARELGSALARDDSRKANTLSNGPIRSNGACRRESVP